MNFWEKSKDARDGSVSFLLTLCLCDLRLYCLHHLVIILPIIASVSLSSPFSLSISFSNKESFSIFISLTHKSELLYTNQLLLEEQIPGITE